MSSYYYYFSFSASIRHARAPSIDYNIVLSFFHPASRRIRAKLLKRLDVTNENAARTDCKTYKTLHDNLKLYDIR